MKAKGIVAAVLLLVQAVSLPAAQAKVSMGSQAAFDEAMVLKEQDNLLSAERKLSEALGEEPANPAYQFELAQIYATRYDRYFQNGYKREAAEMLERLERELKQAVMLRPQFIEARFNLAVVYKRQRRFEESRAQFRRVIEEARFQQDYGSEMMAVMQIGASYEEQGFFEEALEYYRKAQELDMTSDEVRASIDELKIRREQYKERANASNSGSYMPRYLREPVRRITGSLMQERQVEGYQRADSAAGGAMLIPYLGAMLAQQFMNRPKVKKEDLF